MNTLDEQIPVTLDTGESQAEGRLYVAAEWYRAELDVGVMRAGYTLNHVMLALTPELLLLVAQTIDDGVCIRIQGQSAVRVSWDVRRLHISHGMLEIESAELWDEISAWLGALEHQHEEETA